MLSSWIAYTINGEFAHEPLTQARRIDARNWRFVSVEKVKLKPLTSFPSLSQLFPIVWEAHFSFSSICPKVFLDLFHVIRLREPQLQQHSSLRRV